MKRFLALVFLLSVCGLLFASGGDEKRGQAETGIFNLRVANTLPLEHPMNQALVQFVNGVKTRTDGAVNVEIFPNSQLGGNAEMVEGVQLGTIDMCNQFAGAFENYVPEMNVLALAFLFESEDHLYRALDGKAGEVLAEALRRKGFEPLGYFYGGARSLMNNVGPVNSPADLKGLKIRTIPARITLEGVSRMGAIATPMSQADVYSALEQGVLDGWENSPVTLYTLKLYEVTKYVSWSKHFMTPDLFAISSKTWVKLPDEYKEIIREEANKAVDFERRVWNENVVKTVEKLKDEGVEFNEVADIQQFRESTRSLWDEYDKKFQNGLIQAVMDAR